MSKDKSKYTGIKRDLFVVFCHGYMEGTKMAGYDPPEKYSDLSEQKIKELENYFDDFCESKGLKKKTNEQ